MEIGAKGDMSMEQIDPREVQKRHRALQTVMARWLDDAGEEPALRRALSEAQREVEGWERAGHYLGQPVEQLRGQIAGVQALLVQCAQEKERSY
jgi:hypothetical protein